jgi:hypothetical protein
MRTILVLLVSALILIMCLGCEETSTDYFAELEGVYIVTSVTTDFYGEMDFTQFELFEAWFIEFKEDEVISYDNDYTICETTFDSESDEVSAYKASTIEFTDDTYVEYELDGTTVTITDSDGTVELELYTGTFPPPSWTDLTQLPNDSFEPDDSFAEATTIAVGTVNEAHYFGPCDDQDYFMFTAAAGATYVISSTTPDDPDIDPEIDLYNSSQSWIDGDSDSGPDWNFELSWTCPTSGTYYFMVESWLNLDVGNYTVSLVQAPAGLAKTGNGIPEEKKVRTEKPDLRALFFD